MDQEARPRFRKVSIYNSPDKRLSFWYPPEWGLEESLFPHCCVTLQPDPRDPATTMTIEVQDIKAPLAEQERELVSQGVREGLSQLDECQIQHMEELEGVGDWALEWICTFAYDGQRRKRRARLFFSDHYQYSIMFQGATEERFDYWRGMFEWVMLTVRTTSFSLAQYAERQERKQAAQEEKPME